MTSPERITGTETDYSQITADQALRIQEATCGSVAGYILALGVVYKNDPEYSGNLTQIERVARVAYPNDYSQIEQSGFYWGSILGVAAGEYMFGGSWPQLHYDLIKGYLFLNKTDALELLEKDTDKEFVGSNHTLTLVKADIFRGFFDKDSSSLPPEYQKIIDEWAPELSANPRQQQAIKEGFNFNINTVLAQMSYDIERYYATQLIEDLPERLRRSFDEL